MTALAAAEDGAGASPSGVASGQRAPWVIHPIIFGVFPVVALYAQNIHQTRSREVYLPLAIALAGSLILWLLLRVIVRDFCRAGMIASLLVGLLFTVVHVSDAVDLVLEWLLSLWIRTEVHVPVVWASGLETILVLILVTWVIRWRRQQTLWGLTKYLNVLALIAIAMPIGSIFLAKRREPLLTMRPIPALPLAVGKRPLETPDIYYIILDGFARADVQKEIFNYDLEPFLKRLESRGFYVARRSTANYCQTPLSLSSSLNGTYLNDILTPQSHAIGDLGPLIGKGAVIEAVRSQGYKFVSYATGFDQTDHPQADVYRSPYSSYLNGFHRMLLSETPLISLMPNPKERDPYTMTRERTLFAFDTLPEITRDPAPTFTFVHLVAPHPPFVFGENGEDVSRRDIQYFLSDGKLYKGRYPDIDYVAGYRAEVAYLTKRVDEVIEKILRESPKPPVIVLQSDHGPGSRLDTEHVEDSDLHERMSILNAYYLPGKTPADAGLYESITPVNSFRVIFNTYLNAELPLLPDRNYFSTWGNPFTFIDVTDQVRATQDRGSESPRKTAGGHSS